MLVVPWRVCPTCPATTGEAQLLHFNGTPAPLSVWTVGQERNCRTPYKAPCSPLLQLQFSLLLKLLFLCAHMLHRCCGCWTRITSVPFFLLTCVTLHVAAEWSSFSSSCFVLKFFKGFSYFCHSYESKQVLDLLSGWWIEPRFPVCH